MIENVLYYLENSAKNYPDKIAVREEEQTITYAKLLQNAEAIGSALAQFDLIGQPVGVYMEKGIEARVDEVDSMIDMTGGADGSETLGDRIALSALELLHTGYDALEPEIGLEAMENAERLYLSLCEHALRGRELDDAQVEEALDYERSFLGALRMICQQLRPAPAGGANARIIKMAVETATEDGVSGAGIEAAQPAFA